MSHYRSNVRDIEFNLFEVLQREKMLGTGPYEDLDRETVSTMLAEVEHLATTKLAASFAEADREPPVFDPATHTVTLPEAFKSVLPGADGLRLLAARSCPPSSAARPLPPSLQWAANELNLGANPARLHVRRGPEVRLRAVGQRHRADRRIAQIMIERQWGATMVLTEPDAGSDVGAGRTRAIPQPDGTWHIEGVKRFITAGEHDLTENIIHLVLARPVGVAGAGGPGTKGLSLFIVPKYHFDPETGELTGERNGVFATNVEHKMGIKASATCELTFGDGVAGPRLAARRGARRHRPDVPGHRARPDDGGHQGHRHPVHRLPQRPGLRQDPRAGRRPDAGGRQDRAAGDDHPPPRRPRSLMTQKAFAEGTARAGALHRQHPGPDRAGRGAPDHRRGGRTAQRPAAADRQGLRVGAVLGAAGHRVAADLRRLRASCTDYPIEQYVRDAKIDTLYEGTTAIQGQDLFFRKIVRDQGRALGDLSAQIGGLIGAEARQRPAQGGARAAAAGPGGRAARSWPRWSATCSLGPPGSRRDPRNVYKVGLNTTRLLMALGDVICAWLLLRGAEVALDRLNGEQSTAETAFYEGKVASARWFARTVLPKLAAERAIAEATDLDVMDLAEDAF